MKNCFTLSLIIFLTAFESLQAQNLQWAKRLGSKLGDTGYSIAVDNEGNIYSVGSFSQTADFDPGPDSFFLTSHGQRDIYISKLSDDGGFAWARQIGGKQSDAAYGIDIDPSGFIYLTGIFRDTVDFDPSIQSRILYVRDQSEAFIAKFDFDGNLIWANPVTQNLDTIATDIGNAIKVDPLGNIYVFGSFGGSAEFDAGAGDHILTSSGDDDIFLSKYDAAGNFTWAKKIGGAEKEDPFALAIDQQGNILCTGNFSAEADFDPGPLPYLLTAQDTFYDVFILKLNSSGEFVWVKQISGPDEEWSDGITVDQNGNCYTAGAYTSLTDFNYGGNPILLPNPDDFDGYILSLDVDGVFRWVQRIGGIDYQEAWAITSSPGPDGGIYTAGYFVEEAVVDNVNIPGITAKGNTDVFISKLDFNGNIKFLDGIGGTGLDMPYGISTNASTPDNYIYATGLFLGTCDFDPGIDEMPLTSEGSSDIFIVKLDDLTTGIENVVAHESGLDFQVYPNPANLEIGIKFPGMQKVKMIITNSLGVEIQSLEPSVENEIVHLDVSTYPAGIYFLQLNANQKIQTKKLIVSH